MRGHVCFRSAEVTNAFVQQSEKLSLNYPSSSTLSVTVQKELEFKILGGGGVPGPSHVCLPYFFS